jgi:D-inositol-3-phosphate glycosyltransferase
VIAATSIDRSHLETYYEADRQRITILPCGVDLDLFRPADHEEARRSLGLTQERLVLFVGRIQQLKGTDLLLRAAQLLADRQHRGEVPPFKVLIVGGRPSDEPDDPEARELRRLHRLAVQLGIESRVQWVGAVEQTELPRYYHAADVTVVPSTYESFGLVALESMACGTPVVAARVGGLVATVQDGITGYLVSGRDPKDYADDIAALLGPTEIQRRFSAAARARALAFSWQRVATQLLDLYQSLRSFAPEVLRYTVETVQKSIFCKTLIEPEVIRMLLFGLALVLIMRFRPAGLLPSAVRKRELAERKE